MKFAQTTGNRVAIAVAAGLSVAEVADVLGISEPTLRHRFAGEIKNGRQRMLLENLLRLDRAAARGSVSAMKALVSMFSDGALHVGKKTRQQQQAEAAAAALDEWGDDLNLGPWPSTSPQ